MFPLDRYTSRMMFICIEVILFSLPTLFALSHFEAMSLTNYLEGQKHNVKVHRECREALNALTNRQKEMKNRVYTMKDAFENGYISKEFYLSELKKIQAEDEEMQPKAKFYMEKLERSNREILESHSELPDFSHDYEIKTIGVSVNIYQNPSQILLAKQIGGDSLTGHMVWPSAEVLAKYLDESCAKSSWIRGRKIVELGAGTGYVSIIAACLGGDVIATDLPQMVPSIQNNIDKNCDQLEESEGRIRAQILRWGDAEAAKSIPTPDVIFLSDVVYNDTLVGPLVSTMATLSDEGTILFVSQEKRDPPIAWDMFYSQAGKYFKFSPVPNYDNEKFWLFQGTLK